MARRGWPGSRRVVQVVNVGDPMQQDLMGQLSIATSRGMQGRTGSIIIGDPATPGVKYSGDLGPVQHFRGGAALTSNPNILRRPNTALPATAPPPAGVTTVQDLLARIPPSS